MAPWTPGCSKIPSTELLPPVTIELGRVLHADGVGVGQQPVVEAPGPARPLRRDEQLLLKPLSSCLLGLDLLTRPPINLGRRRDGRCRMHTKRGWRPAADAIDFDH